MAIQHLLAQGEGTLIHAKVWSIARGMFIGHALVETDTGYVYEPVTDRYFDKAWLYRTYMVQEFKRYKFNEALEACAKNRHYGPWDEESLRMPQKGGNEGQQSIRAQGRRNARRPRP